MYDGATVPSTPHTIKPENVRGACPGDEAAILDILREGHLENGTFSFSDAKVLEMIKKATQAKGAMIGVIDAPDGSIAACTGTLVDQYWYTETDWVLTELWAFVRKPFRNSRFALDLIEFNKWAADSMGIPLSMGIMSTHKTEAKTRLYRRHLLHIGGFFMWGLERAHGPLAREDFSAH